MAAVQIGVPRSVGAVLIPGAGKAELNNNASGLRMEAPGFIPGLDPAQLRRIPFYPICENLRNLWIFVFLASWRLCVSYYFQIGNRKLKIHSVSQW